MTERRDLLAMLGALPLLAAAARGGRAAAPSRPLSWDRLQKEAAALARRPFRAGVPVAAAMEQGYDAGFAIRYRPEAALADAVHLLPVSRTAPVPVRIHLVAGATAHEVAFAPEDFASPEGGPRALGLAGFRALYPGRDPDWLAYLGASYFRAAGSDGQYGLSARAVAIDTGIEGAEEFPAFTGFWLEPHGRDRLVIHALLDGPSITGAFRYDSRLTADGVVQDVASVLHLRRDVRRLGIAPATSMFWYGEGDRAAAVDWRPEIHDSDGLSILSRSGERIWRPMVNPRAATLNSFVDTDPAGFGLVQRDREFAHYQDDSAFYDRRPNLWVEPQGRWGSGAVTLYSFPTHVEIVDNVVAFWTPDAPARAGARLAFDYRLTWSSRDPAADAPSRAVATWTGSGGRPGEVPSATRRKLVVDFAGGALAGLDIRSGVDLHLDLRPGRVVESHAYPVVGQPQRWRAMVDVAPEGDVPAECRLWLGRAGSALSETVIVPIS